LDLTVEFTVVTRTVNGNLVDPLRVCDRCHDESELVVATMKILPVEGSLFLCGPCVSEMPRGYHLA
jgi:hypothetical protein